MPAPERDELFTLYRIAIDEYRFEVKLNTDRMMHYVIFNSAIITVAHGPLKNGDGLLAQPVRRLGVRHRCLHVTISHAQHSQRPRILPPHDLQKDAS